MIRNFDLRRKKVIDADTAELVGYIRDIDIDFESGRINSVTIPRCGFHKTRSITVPWERIQAMGKEFVIIKQRESNN